MEARTARDLRREAKARRWGKRRTAGGPPAQREVRVVWCRACRRLDRPLVKLPTAAGSVCVVCVRKYGLTVLNDEATGRDAAALLGAQQRKTAYTAPGAGLTSNLSE